MRTILQRDCSAKNAPAQPTQDTAQECLFNSTADLVVEQLAGTATDTPENDGECGETPACIIHWDNGCTSPSAITGKKDLSHLQIPLTISMLLDTEQSPD